MLRFNQLIMSSNLKRLGFDATLDEIVDASMRLVQHTTTYRRQRKQYQWFVGVCAAGGVAVPALRGHELLSLPLLAIEFFAAAVVGVGCGALYGAYHHQHVRRNYRKLIKEMYGGAEQIRCEFELWFDPGLVVIRDRAFQTQAERRDFLDSVRQHLTA
jgi:hypothetical protein